MAGEEQKGICPRNGQPCEDITALKVKVQNMEAWQNATDMELRELTKGFREILEFQGGTKVYVAEIKQQITALETRLFSFMTDLVKNLTAKESTEDERAAKERSASTKSWLDFAKFIIGGTIFLIVAYFFGRGV